MVQLLIKIIDLLNISETSVYFLILFRDIFTAVPYFVENTTSHFNLRVETK